MAETEASHRSMASFIRTITRAWPPRALAELRAERRKFLDERDNLLNELRDIVEEMKRASEEVRAAADAAVRRIGHAAARPDDAQNREPSHGELLCSALLEYWKVDTNWNTHAIRALEALAHDGKGNLAQWGAQELLSGGTIALSATSGSKTRQRLTRLADDGTALEDWGKGKNISAKAQAPSSTDGGEHEQSLEPAGAARPLPEVEPG